jgi:hypothetical protein
MRHPKLSSLIKGSLVAIIAATSLTSCQKMFDVEPKDYLQQDQVYRNVYDADAIILGLYGKFSALADKYIVLNEVRSDLLDATYKSSNYIKEINEHRVTKDNPYADPRPFYELISNCNDAMKNFTIMKEKNILDNTQYYQRYVEAGMLRTWVYLQLGIHYGKVPYITEPIEDINDVKNQSKFQKLEFDQLLDKLLEFTNTIPAVYLNQNTSAASPTLIMAMNGYPIQNGVFKFFIHRKSLIGDLNLWKGNYVKAAEVYKEIMELDTYTTTNPDQRIDQYDTYRIVNDNSGKFNLMTTGTEVPWSDIFNGELAAIKPNIERMWTIPLNKDFAPRNPLINLFDYSLDYAVKPSQLSINKWDEQVREDGGLEDRRGELASYRYVGLEPQVAKYTLKYSVINPFEKTGVWVLYRAGALHLRYAEAANRSGYSDVAGIIMNDGFKTKGKTYATNPYPFDFDGSVGTVNGNWYRNIGIRGRAVNRSVAFDLDNLLIDTEDKILDEAALELAFEGYRWQDLLRIALRREAIDPNFLANKVADKLDLAGNPEAASVRAKLTNKANWYLPFNW